jgi:transcriptional regulator with XRE-family HTH domain
MTISKKSFGARLQALREKAHLSREQLATAAGMNREAVRLYELGERRPTWDAVQALAKALGVTTDTFRDRV